MKDNKNEKIELLEEMAKRVPLIKDKDYEKKMDSIPSGSISLDMAIGINGYPKGAIIDIYGEESSGKSLLTIMAISQLQKKNGIAVIWDAERSYSKNMEWMRINGVDTSKLYFLKLSPDKPAEDGFAIIEEICKNKAADLIIIDSIPSLVPSEMLKKEIGENMKLGARASLLTNVLPRLSTISDENNVTIMMINQMRAFINGGLYGPSERETSIFALKHYSTLRLEVQKINKSFKFDNGIPISHRIRVKVVKNKVAPAYRTCEFEINYLKGVDNLMEIAEILVSAEIAKRKGAWIEYDGQKYQGIEKLYDALCSNKELVKKSLERIKNSKANTFGILTNENSVSYEDIPQEL